jgi:transcriptional regulator with XRE-family HTH domain
MKSTNVIPSEVSYSDFINEVGYKNSLVTDLVLEIINERIVQGMSQHELAVGMKTKQPVISRFENLGRQPSVSFIERVAEALGCSFRGTIYGDYMYVVPEKLRDSIKTLAEFKGITVNELLFDRITAFLAENVCTIRSWESLPTTSCFNNFSTRAGSLLSETQYGEPSEWQNIIQGDFQKVPFVLAVGQ